MTTAWPPAAPLVLRDLVDAVLRKQLIPVSAQAVADVLGGTPLPQVHRVLRELEQQGLAVRERGRPWATTDQWRAAPSGTPQAAR